MYRTDQGAEITADAGLLVDLVHVDVATTGTDDDLVAARHADFGSGALRVRASALEFAIPDVV